VLHLRGGRGRFEVARARPSPALAELVEHFWLVSWDLRGRDPHLQHTLPHPGVHLVAEPDHSGIQGVLTGRFSRRLEGAGRAFGVRFRPAGFQPFLGAPVAVLTDRRVPVAEPEHSGIQGVLTGRFSRRLEGAGRAFGVRFRPAGFQPFLGAPVAVLTDRRVPVAEVFGPDGDRLVARLLAAGDQARRVAAAEAFLLARRPAPDPSMALVNRVVDQIMADREITRVGDVADRAGVGTRRLQRLFATYVGVSPKWVIRRARLHEAVERLDEGEDLDLAFLARELGYFDQAHFARDFRDAVGRPPTAYARAERGGRSAE
jgi:AraC-like DNA-binding protein